jgi:hypothetical protein
VKWITGTPSAVRGWPIRQHFPTSTIRQQAKSLGLRESFFIAVATMRSISRWTGWLQVQYTEGLQYTEGCQPEQAEEGGTVPYQADPDDDWGAALVRVCAPP